MHQLVGPFELAGPHGQAEQDQRDAARPWDRAADETESDKDEAEEADSDAIDSEFAFVLPDLATPAPAVLLRLDEDVVMVMLVLGGRPAVRGVSLACGKVAVGTSASRESLSSTPDDMATTLK